MNLQRESLKRWLWLAADIAWDIVVAVVVVYVLMVVL